MRLSQTSFRNLNPASQKFLVAHEFGHMIGLRHTNWRMGESETGSYNGQA